MSAGDGEPIVATAFGIIRAIVDNRGDDAPHLDAATAGGYLDIVNAVSSVFSEELMAVADQNTSCSAVMPPQPPCLKGFAQPFEV